MSDRLKALELVQQSTGKYFAIIETDTGRYVYALSERPQEGTNKRFGLKPVEESGIEGVIHSASLNFPASDMGMVSVKTLTIPVNSKHINRLMLGIVPFQVDQEQTTVLENVPALGDLTTRFVFNEPVFMSITT